MLIKITVSGWLGLCTIFDLKNKRIPVWSVAAGGILSVGMAIYCLLTGSPDEILIDRIIAVIPGGLLFLLAIGSKEKIGLGDGLIMLELGLLEGLSDSFLALCMALFLQAIPAIIILAAGRGDRTTRLPFIPFLLLGQILVWLFM